jgi:hypothetical protein
MQPLSPRMHLGMRGCGSGASVCVSQGVWGGGGAPATFFRRARPPSHRTMRQAEEGEAGMTTEDRLPQRRRLRPRSRERGGAQGRSELPPLRRIRAAAILLS